jgi:putative RecB family exonuclease
MKTKKTSPRPRPEFVTLDDLEAWLSCRLRWKLTQYQPPDAEPPPWEHLQRCLRESVFFFHRERVRLGKIYYASVQEFFWNAFECQSLEASRKYAYPGDRAWDMRAGEAVLEKYVAQSPNEGPPFLGSNLGLSAHIPGARLPLDVRADFLRPGPVPVLLEFCRDSPDVPLETFRLAPWAAAVSAAIREHFGREVRGLEAVFLVVNEPAQVVRLTIPPPPPETMDKLRLWLTAFASGLARGDIFPQPGSHCGYCPFRVPCAKWPK